MKKQHPRYARSVERVKGMKLQVNKFIDLMENHPEHLKFARWESRAKQMTLDVDITEKEIMRMELASDPDAERRGVSIDVPLLRFDIVKPDPPGPPKEPGPPA